MTFVLILGRLARQGKAAGQLGAKALPSQVESLSWAGKKLKKGKIKMARQLKKAGALLLFPKNRNLNRKSESS